MKILVYLGHPAQYHFLKCSIRELRKSGHHCTIVIKTKDVLENLLSDDGEEFFNILPEGRKQSEIRIIYGLIKRDLRLFCYVLYKKYDLFIGTDPCVAHVGKLLRIPVLTVLEDDIHVISQLARITFPFTSVILTPNGCQTGKYEKKTIYYKGYMKLAYLHPKRFKKEAAKFKQPYFLIRASKLDAYHDAGINGFTVQILLNIVKQLQDKGSVYISSEGFLDEYLKQYELKINPSEMQQVLANATLLISDSQSMTMEAAMLGVPSIRFSDFAGRISVLEELENVYGLTFGIPTSAPEKLFEKLNELLSHSDLEREFIDRRQKMLGDKIDVTAFMVWFIENYPGSVKIMKENPEFQERFK